MVWQWLKICVPSSIHGLARTAVCPRWNLLLRSYIWRHGIVVVIVAIVVIVVVVVFPILLTRERFSLNRIGQENIGSALLLIFCFPYGVFSVFVESLFRCLFKTRFFCRFLLSFPRIGKRRWRPRRRRRSSRGESEKTETDGRRCLRSSVVVADGQMLNGTTSLLIDSIDVNQC